MRGLLVLISVGKAVFVWMLSYVFRLYPNKNQRAGLERSLEYCRQAYNFLLEKLRKEKLGRSEIQHGVVELKKAKPEFDVVYSKALQYEPYRLFSNIRTLSVLKKNGRKVGRLRFKGKDWFKTFSYNQSGFSLKMVKSRKGVLRLSKIGDVKIKVHRPVEGIVKQVTLKNHLGKWFAILITDAKPKRAHGEKVLGLDLGINNYVVDSEGNKIPHPHSVDKHAKRLALAQRGLARKKRGSSNRKKTKFEVAKVHEKIVRCRGDFLHKLSNKYVRQCRTIVVEDLNIIGLVRSSRSARNVMDSSWSRFLQLLCYKAESAGCKVAKVDPRNTTKMCSKCGNIQEMPLWKRIYNCSNCGVVMDRDYNSALNILHKYLGREPALAREPPPTRKEQGGSMKQETSMLERLAFLKDAHRFSGG